MDVRSDNDGKKLYGILLNELRGMRKGRDDLVDVVMKHVMNTETASIDELTAFLIKQFDPSKSL